MRHSGYHTASDGNQLWWGTVGEGPTLVLCDGFACDGFIWPYVIDHFHEDHRIVRWHYRGHGESDIPAEDHPVGIEQLCNDLHGLLEEIGDTPAVLLGHSMGVQVILQYAAMYPTDVRALVALCGTYKRPLDTFHNNDLLKTLLPYIDRMVNAAPDQVQSLWGSVAPSRFSRFASRVEINPKLARQADMWPYLEHVGDMNVQFFVRMLKELSEHSTEEFLPQIACPVLVVAGEHDTFTPMYRSEELAGTLPHGELLVVPSGTHIAPLEIPDLINAAIEKFLRGVGG